MLYGLNVGLKGVIIAAVASFILGFLWYGPIFGNYWAKLMKMSKKSKPKNLISLMIMNFIGVFLTALVLSLLVSSLNVVGWSSSILFAFWIWLGFFASATLLNGSLWEGKTLELYFLNAVFWFINLIMMTWIVSYF